MALNPIVYTENVVRNFLRYQLTRFPFSDQRLYQQMRWLAVEHVLGMLAAGMTSLRSWRVTRGLSARISWGAWPMRTGWLAMSAWLPNCCELIRRACV